jgi:hypothetical protein
MDIKLKQKKKPSISLYSKRNRISSKTTEKKLRYLSKPKKESGDPSKLHVITEYFNF